MVSPMSLLRDVASFVRRVFPWALLFVGVFVVSKAVKPTGAFGVGERLPSFTAKLLDGTSFELKGKPGEVVVLNFWASYCAPCREEAPLLSALGDRGLKVVGLPVEDASDDSLRAAAKSFGMTFPIAKSDPKLVELFKVRTVPTTYVVAADGAVVLSRVGKVQADDLDDALTLAKKRARSL